MSYHSVILKLIDDFDSNYHVYNVATKYHEFASDYSMSTAYTMESENHEVLRWASNNAVVPKDIMDKTNWIHKEKMNEIRDMETELALAVYYKAQSERTPEQISEQRTEARAAHGTGVTLINILTDEKYIT